MTITQAEDVKRQWTDQYVVVQAGIAELRRFQGLTGRVKTVNMSGRALVQFDGPVDIGWYDIDPTYLQRVDQPLPKAAAGHAEKGHAKPAQAEAAPAAKAPAKGGSPLDQIRKQGAAPAAAAGGKPSPLDLIRKQGAAQVAAPPAEPAAAAPVAAPSAPAAAPAAPASGMSPLDLIRKQGAAKR